MTLDWVLKTIGAKPQIQSPKTELTQFQREIDKLRYRIGAIPYRTGQEYLKEPVQWNVINQGIYDKIKF
ncbi:hypothetical protein HYW20_06010 [Candidatus Woesearchaeota archaeon]|nr:hypothetical protein [Candidatus Woesearchaeota archaeon]